MIELFQKIPVTLPKPVDYINKQKMLFTYKGGNLYIYKYKSKLPTMKSPRLREESQNKEDDIKKSWKISSTLELLEIPNPLE